MDKALALDLLADAARLAEILPEVWALKDCRQLGPHHQEGDVLTHVKELIKNLPPAASPELVWAGILHDIAKPATRVEREREGEIITQFFNHEVLGADLADKVTARLGLEEKSRGKISWLVRNHMRILALPQMREGKAKEFVQHPYFSDLLKLFRADLAASIARDEVWKKKSKELLRAVEEVVGRWADKEE